MAIATFVRHASPSLRFVVLCLVTCRGTQAHRVSQLELNYPKLVQHDPEQVAAAQTALKQTDAFFTALGVYSSQASEANMDEIERYNIELAQLIVQQNPNARGG